MDNRQRLKQIAHEYAHTHRRMGIFQLRNKETGTYFVNSSMDLDKIWNRLYTQLQTGIFVDPNILKEWKQYGEEAFEIIELEVLKPEEEYVATDADRLKYKPILKKRLEDWKERLESEK